MYVYTDANVCVFVPCNFVLASSFHMFPQFGLSCIRRNMRACNHALNAPRKT